MHRISLFLTITFLWFQGSANAQDPIGTWTGTAHSQDEDTRLILEISESETMLEATMSLPDIGVSGWPAQTVKFKDGILDISFPSDSGPQRMQFRIQNDQMTGSWSENRFENDARIELLRIAVDRSVKEYDVEVSGPVGRLGATLIMPACADGCNAVVFLHGSGPQPRDSNRFAAYQMADSGIASIIFDKRGVRDSDGKLAGASFYDLAMDAIAVAEVLKAQPGVISVGFFGHSQGGWIASLAGSIWEETAFVITSAGPAVPPSREAEWDVVRSLRQNGRSLEEEEDARQVVRLWHDGVRSGDWAPFDLALNNAKSQTWYDDSGIEAFGPRPSPQFVDSYRAFMDYDPLPALTSLSAPMLAILAPDDESIDAKETEELLRDLIQKGYDISIKTYPGYDHTMRGLRADGSVYRWPEHPSDYFSSQVEFIREIDR